MPLLLLLLLAMTPYAHAEPQSTNGAGLMEPDSSVTLQWEAVPNATNYTVLIARDPALRDVITTIDSSKTSATSQLLPPGAYYWAVDAFNDMERLHRSKTKPIVVGSPYKVSATPRVLPPPQTLYPPNTALYAPDSKVRLAWAPVTGAQEYVVRIWDEDKIKEDKLHHIHNALSDLPRWETVVPHPWIVVHDAPYTSFMYLDAGTYRWEVAGLDPASHQAGQTASGTFEMNKKVFFKPNVSELEGALAYLALNSSHQSAEQNTSYHLQGSRIGGALSWNWWGGYLWGLRAQAQLYDSGLNTPLSFYSLEARYRHKISNQPYGWHFELAFGAEFVQLPLAEVYNNSPSDYITNVDAIGPVIEPAFAYRFASAPLQWKFAARLGAPLLLVTNNGGGGSINFAADTHLINEWRWFTSPKAFLSAQLDLFLSDISFTPSDVSSGRSTVKYLGPALRFGIGLYL